MVSKIQTESFSTEHASRARIRVNEFLPVCMRCLIHADDFNVSSLFQYSTHKYKSNCGF